jgi:hypothetical protein
VHNVLQNYVLDFYARNMKKYAFAIIVAIFENFDNSPDSVSQTMA